MEDLEQPDISMSKRKREPLPRVAYSVTEWSQITGVSRPTIYRQMDSGELRFVLLRKMRRIPATELVRLKLIAA
jgi:excisionase family DNA binding protein